MDRINNIKADRTRTVAQLRKDVRQLQKEVNKVLYETGDNMTPYKEYFLKDTHDKRVGGITTNKGVHLMNKAELVNMYNRMANFVNADTSSTYYKNWVAEKDKQNIKKMKKTFREMGYNLNDEQISQYFEVKNMFPEIFGQDEFYKEVLSIGREFGRKEDGKRVIDTVIQAKNEIDRSGQPYDNEMLKEKIYELSGLTKSKIFRYDI